MGGTRAPGRLPAVPGTLTFASDAQVDLAEASTFPDGTVIHVYQPITATG